MHTYEARVIADQATGRPLAGVRVTVEDAETGVPVQPYRDGAPVQLVTGTYGLITEWQTDETTRRVALTAGPVRLTQWCLEVVATASTAGPRLDELEAKPSLPPGGVAGDFLTRTATGFRWMPPVMDLGDVIVDVSGLYFIDNGDGTSTPAHPELFVDNADGTSTLKGA